MLNALSGVAVRERVSPWRTAVRSARRGWAQLYRWVLDVRGLFHLGRPVPEGDHTGAVRRVLFSLLAMAPVGLVASSDCARAFAAAASLR